MRVLRTTLLLVLLLPAIQAGGAQYEDHAGYRIHYATFSSLIIPAEVASAHGIVRSGNRIVLNVSIKQDDQPAAARVQGQVMNLLNQQFELEFREVQEADAIYYLASHLALEHDILRFSLSILPGEAETPVAIDFVRRYD